MNRSASLVLFTLLVFFAANANAQLLTGPEFAQADGGGAFIYTVQMIYPESGAEFGGYTIYGDDNILEGTTWIDGFCMSFVEGGTFMTYDVWGTLEDPGQGGSVTFEWFGCNPGFIETVTTIILAPAVPTDTTNWSALKALYR